MIKEIQYLEYRDSEANLKKLTIFKSSRAILIVSPKGDIEEIDVTGKYHFECLYQRFLDFPGIDQNDEYVSSCVAAREGYIIFIIDDFGISMFYPESLTNIQKENVLSVLRQIDLDYLVFAGTVSVNQELEIQPFNSGDEISIKELMENIEKIPTIELGHHK